MLMKQLIILRHAKSSWEDPKIKDVDRPLIQKGKNRTMLIAEYMMNNGIQPQLIISSPAVRAFDTAEIIAMALNVDLSLIIQNPDLYFVDVEKYHEIVFSMSDDLQSLLIVGHNPMITEFCNSFLGSPIDNMPTSGLCVVSFDTDRWSLITTSSCKVDHLVFPKKLENQ